MQYNFKKILVPVDFTVNTEVAVKKALELADEGTAIHLLHVEIENNFKRKFGINLGHHNHNTIKEVEEKLFQWRQSIEETNSLVKVTASINKGDSIQEVIEAVAIYHASDLIIIGKNSQHSLLPVLNTVMSNAIAKNTGVPVLTAKPGAIHNRIKTMVVPITTDAATHKKEIIAAISRKFRVKIYLVTFMSDNNKPLDMYASALLSIYQWIRTSLHCQVEYCVLKGHNKAKTILEYAEKLNADILLVNSKTETKIGWMNSHISDMLPVKSNLQVLVVQPNS